MKKRIFLIVIPLLLVLAGVVYLTASAIRYNYMHTESLTEVARLRDSVYSKYFELSLEDRKETKSYYDLVITSDDVILPAWYVSYFGDPVINVSYIVNTDVVDYWVRSFYEPAVNAEIIYDDVNGWQLVESYDTYSFDVSAEVALVTAAIKEGVTQYVIGSKISADVHTEDLLSDYGKVSWLNDFCISYAGEPYINYTTLRDFVDDNYNVAVEDLDLSALRKQLENRWNTVGKTVDFVTTGGATVTQPYITYGTTINWDKELEAIQEALESHTSYEVDAPALRGYDDFTNTYIEISLDDQHVWHYVDGELCCDTDCVTGTKNKRDTPTGIYYVSERIPGKYLIGADYKTWVDRWMRLTNDGVGLHDASWRSKFGGNIYTYDGSHGCINLPKSYAYQLFEEIKNGIPTIIY